MTELQERLFSMQDLKFRDFTASLKPGLSKERIIGVRIPALRALAKELGEGQRARELMESLPHEYNEEDDLHALLICRIGDYDRCLQALEGFLPYIDNWATCDLLSPKALRGDRPDLRLRAEAWVGSPHTYVCRFGLGVLMRCFLDEGSAPWALELAASVESREYYVRMMQAWLFAEALVKDYDLALGYIRAHRLESWTHNKAIQKARESRRIGQEEKDLLKNLKIRL